MDKYYFYNGFGEPEQVDINDLILTDNYAGDIDFLEEHNEYKNGSDNDYNEMMAYYGILKNPTLEDFKEMNRKWFPSNELLTNLKKTL